MNVSETHWAQNTRETYASLAESIPAAMETELKLWQRRVDRKNAHQETVFSPHNYLFSITCQRYAMKDGRFAPAEPAEELTLLIVADSRPDAVRRAEGELAAHGYDPASWSYRSSFAPLIHTT